MWWIYALLSATFAALTAVLAKIGIQGVNSDLATALRTVVILVVAWALVLARGSTAHISALTARNWLFIGLSGVATGLSWLFYFRALQVGKVTQVAPVDKLSVALTLLLSVVFLGERLTWPVGLGATLIIAGTLVLIWG